MSLCLSLCFSLVFPQSPCLCLSYSLSPGLSLSLCLSLSSQNVSHKQLIQQEHCRRCAELATTLSPPGLTNVMSRVHQVRCATQHVAVVALYALTCAAGRISLLPVSYQPVYTSAQREEFDHDHTQIAVPPGEWILGFSS